MHDFDTLIERRDTYSSKWNKYAGKDVLPFWVADMDYASPNFILDAIRQRLDHGIIGYTVTPAPVVAAFCGWLERNYGWQVDPDWLVWLPGVVPGMNLAARAIGNNAAEFIVPVPVYHPFLDIAGNCGKTDRHVALVRGAAGWTLDPDDLAAALTPNSRGVLMTNPQNPTGRVYAADELDELARFCVDHDLVVVSDEIHCQLLLDADVRHIPIATRSDAIMRRSITLYSPNKAYNTAGLGSAVAVIPDPDLRGRFRTARAGLITGVSPLAYAVAEAAYGDQSSYLAELNGYLAANHELLDHALEEMPGVQSTPVEGTYLKWLNLRELRLDSPAAHLERHGLGLSDGAEFGAPGFVRFNFACPRSLLERGIERLKKALQHA